ncbi:MAG TPA: hypothetical protein DCL54_12005 [Alphaproteobacteria bacterium]|nr:hypothetical protein [Alphaproteobacteria bacterium]HAJ47291.1 hypothetical protein [Alphaproteobacteria bacterium]
MQLSAIAFNPKVIRSNEKARVESAYHMWLEVWQDAYRKYGWDPRTVRGDQWSRQDQILTLFDRDHPVGCVLFHIKDLRAPWVRDDSYFRMWPAAEYQKLLAMPDPEHTLIGSYLTVAHAYRRSEHGVNAKAAMIALSMRYFQQTGFHHLIGTMVHNARVNDVSKQLGANVLKSGVEEAGVMTDLVVWYARELAQLSFGEIDKVLDTVTGTWKADGAHLKTQVKEIFQ